MTTIHFAQKFTETLRIGLWAASHNWMDSMHIQLHCHYVIHSVAT